MAGVTYTLTINIGFRRDLPGTGTARLLVGDNAVYATGVALPGSGAFSLYTATYTATATDAGRSIGILLNSAGMQGDFDLVGLSDSTVAGVPEPATWALVVGGFAWVGVAARRRRAGVIAA